MAQTNPWGIDEQYYDGRGKSIHLSDAARTALLSGMDADPHSAPPEPPLVFARQGTTKPLAGTLRLEDGTTFTTGSLPPDLPLGYHNLITPDGRELRLIVSPEHCYFPDNLHIWGWALQLYALRSQSSWGIGDFDDLRRFSTWSADRFHSQVIMTNPFGASAPGVPQQPSPYFSSSRLFRNPLYLSIPHVPGAHHATPDLSHFESQARILNDSLLIDRDAIYQLKMRALDAIWPHVRERLDLTAYESTAGPLLNQFAAYSVLAEDYGPNWRNWPTEYHRPTPEALARVGRQHGDRMAFHKWLQWLLDQQLEQTCERRTIMQDLPIGVDPDGFDTWVFQDTLAKNVSVGAPPDPFSADGQDWGLPPFVPHKLRAAFYEPYIQTLRAALRHSAGLRIDHVMGLFRLFWIPVGHPRSHGTYVRYHADEMLSILALESARAKAYIVGEDLGTVEDGVREKLAHYRVLSYRVMWFENKAPEQYPKLALASVSTHDLATIAGVWTGADLREQEDVGLHPDPNSNRELRSKLENLTGLPSAADTPTAILKAHEKLAQAPSAIIVASLDDVLAAPQRPNLPGTMNDRRPNWSIPLPKTLEGAMQDETLLQVSSMLQQSRVLTHQ